MKNCCGTEVTHTTKRQTKYRNGPLQNNNKTLILNCKHESYFKMLEFKKTWFYMSTNVTYTPNAMPHFS